MTLMMVTTTTTIFLLHEVTQRCISVAKTKIELNIDPHVLVIQKRRKLTVWDGR